MLVPLTLIEHLQRTNFRWLKSATSPQDATKSNTLTLRGSFYGRYVLCCLFYGRLRVLLRSTLCFIVNRQHVFALVAHCT